MSSMNDLVKSMGLDLRELTKRKLMIAGIETEPIVVETQHGPQPAVKIVFQMQDGEKVGPIIIDPTAFINLCAAVTINLAGIAAQQGQQGVHGG